MSINCHVVMVIYNTVSEDLTHLNFVIITTGGSNEHCELYKGDEF